jgi:phenylacetyl-CoA:acceptor oxidoreductase subunit 2
MSFGPNPWQQAHWDWRAAGNFICGGAGSGLIVVATLSGAHGAALTALLLAGLALIGLGLLCVALETGRPLRALNVFINPRTSWMSREAIAAALLVPATLAAALAWPVVAWLAALLALAFLYCQSRMLRAARGIRAWRATLVPPLIVATGLTEGLGLLLVGAAWLGIGSTALVAVLAALAVVRIAMWTAYRRQLGEGVAVAANAALDHAGRWLQLAGTAVPLLVLAYLAGPDDAMAGLATALGLVAGLAATLSGSWFKFVLVTRAGYNQGFALERLPVRGVAHI